MTFEEYLKQINVLTLKDYVDSVSYGQFFEKQVNIYEIIKHAEAWHKSELSKAGKKGAKARHDKLSPERRKEIAKMGGLARRAVAVWLKK